MEILYFFVGLAIGLCGCAYLYYYLKKALDVLDKAMKLCEKSIARFDKLKEDLKKDLIEE